MREVIQPPPIVNVYDDISLHESKAKVQAAQTITVAFNGKTVELDVSLEHYSEIAEFMHPLMEAGRKVGSRPGRAPGPQGPLDPARLKYLRGLREWVKRCDLKNEAGNGWAYETNTGTHKTYYSVALLAKYDAYLEVADKPAKR
jgi:hypothetical protein